MQAVEILHTEVSAVWLKLSVRAERDPPTLPQNYPIVVKKPKQYGKHFFMEKKYCFLIRARDVREVFTRQVYGSKPRKR